jgi:predicted metalloprotease with PDZ domain
MNYSARPLISFLLFSIWISPGAAGRAQDPPIVLEVDATEAPRKIIHAKLDIPVKAGPLTFYLPKWIPGNHGPTGPIAALSGLKLEAGGKSIAWKRDAVDMFAFHCEVPEGIQNLQVSLDSCSGGNMASSTEKMAMIRWNEMLVYPKGRSQQEIHLKARLRLPAGWKLGTALPVVGHDGDVTHFEPVSLETLIDSPVICGANFKEVSLGTHDGRPHFLDLACDGPAGLELAEDVRKMHERLVVEAGALFGARHYRGYRFLLTLSERMGFHGLEHHESSDDGGPEKMLVDKSARDPFAFLLPHEYVHSWNGKYRRPAGLVTHDFQGAQETGLLWVYEGLTEYLGTILTARCGLWTPEETRDYLALTADTMQSHRGRMWRPLEDTAVAAPLNHFSSNQWVAWHRSADYYDEATLIWLEVDTRIRMLTNGQRSLDDFCRSFFGGASGNPEVKPYTFDDVVAGLNAITPYDWRELLTRRLTATGENAPLEGLAQSGWKLAYGDKPSAFFKSAEGLFKMVNQSSTIGLILSPEGNVIDVIPGSAADRAHIGPGMKLIAVNTRKWTAEGLAEAIAASNKPANRIELLFENSDFFKTSTLDYHGGAKYPKLEKNAAGQDLLAEILKPLKP